MFGAGDGVSRYEDRALGEHLKDLADHRGFDRADLGENGAAGEMRRDQFDGICRGADRYGDQHQFRVLRRFRRCVGDLIAKAELLGAGVHLRREVVAHDAPGKPADLGTAGDRGTDQPEPDNSDGVKQRFGHWRLAPEAPMNDFSASSTARFSSSVPMVMRRASGNPYSSTRRKMMRRDWRNVSASTAE